MIRFQTSQDQHDCCGCSACMNICPQHAIVMRKKTNGFEYPVVDMDICVNCGLCSEVCPMEKDQTGQEADPDIYAAAYKETDVVRSSSSGGIFTAIAKWILEHDGVVFGAAFDKDFMVKHIRVTDADELARLRGSKYVESNISDLFESVEQDLKAGRYVLVSGTPCQISALRSYIAAKHIDDSLLFLCDVICHGVPSRKVWKDYLTILQDKYVDDDDYITGINMRSKQAAWQKQELQIDLCRGSIDEEVKGFSFNKFFLSLYANRPSCFCCRYTSYKRSGDISLGDFWNYKQAGISFDPEYGISEMFVNTEKGETILSDIKEKLYIQEITKEAGWQPHLEFSAKEPGKRKLFWKEYLSSDDHEKVMRKYMKGSMLSRLIHSISPLLRETGLYTFAGRLYRKVFSK